MIYLWLHNTIPAHEDPEEPNEEYAVHCPVLLKLKKKVTLTNEVAPICLPFFNERTKINDKLYKKHLHAIGRGITSTQGNFLYYTPHDYYFSFEFESELINNKNVFDKISVT